MYLESIGGFSIIQKLYSNFKNNFVNRGNVTLRQKNGSKSNTLHFLGIHLSYLENILKIVLFKFWRYKLMIMKKSYFLSIKTMIF